METLWLETKSAREGAPSRLAANGFQLSGRLIGGNRVVAITVEGAGRGRGRARSRHCLEALEDTIF